MINIALSYLNLGWVPVPMRPQTSFFRDKKPYIKWKKYQSERPTKKDIKEWWSKWPGAGIGIVTGKISGIVAIDFDGEGAQYLYREKIGNRPGTISFSSRPGHEQDLYKYPEERDIKNITGLMKGVDIRGEGGLIVVPPTKHWSGSDYTWGNINPLEDSLTDLLELPLELLDLILSWNSVGTNKKPPAAPSASKIKTEMPDWMIELSKGVSRGERNAAAARVCGWYLRYFRGDIVITRLSMEGWNSKNDPPLDAPELERVITKISKRHGKDDLGVKSGLNIDRMIFHKAPDGDSKFEIFINNNKEESIILSPSDLCSNLSFRTKIVAHSGVLPNSIPNKEFVPLMQKILKEAEVKIINPSLTHEGFIAEIIQQNLTDTAPDLSSINQSFVIIDDMIYFKMNKLKELVIKSKEDPMSRFAIAQCLKKLGFKQKRVRDDEEVQHRTWTQNINNFKERCR